MDYLPLYVDLRDKGCLVVGAGAVALRKIELLLKAGARVRVMAPECIEAIQGLADAGSIDLATRPYQTGDQAGHALVIAATGNASVDGQVFRDCRTDGILVNTVDSPDLSSAIFPSIVDRDPVLVAVSTGGRSPTLARVVRGWLEARLPPALGRLADFAAARRAIVKRTIESVSGRRKFWERVVGGATGELVLSGDVDRAGQQFTRELQESGPPAGFVALVGAGPGDPELITVRGLRLLQQADVVLYDNLVNERILGYARREAERIYVGKRRRFAGMRQEAINEMLLEHATAGRCVVRLKGGDPFIFGRGGEEIETLAAHGIDCVVVPGITAALGAASYAGIPLTHRKLAHSVRFVTGHRVHDEVNLNWPELIDPTQTLVIYMGLLGLAEICAKLVANGLPPDTPALMIERATLPDHKEIAAPVGELPDAVAGSDVRGPTVVIVGEVVRLRRPGPAGLPD